MTSSIAYCADLILSNMIEDEDEDNRRNTTYWSTTKTKY